MIKREVTLQRLEDAFERLKQGKAIKVKVDGKISMNKINHEAGLSHGAINYYKDFKAKARAELELISLEELKGGVVNSLHGNEKAIVTLKESRKRERELKNRYLAELKSSKTLSDEIVRRNVSLAFRIVELEDQLNQISSKQIISISK
tara:strand:+ start:1678 stop:2121 length:444 start_codon:yes stop_codon:yes gene_type:complete